MGALLLILSLLFPTIESDFECLTEAVYYEAGNQSLSGMLDVAQVIENRVNHKSWSDSYCKVIRQKSQFSYYWDGKPEPIPKWDNPDEHRAVNKSKLISLVVLSLPITDQTNGALYYHSGKIPKGWKKDRIKLTKTSGDHKMYANAD
jgi:spore germination cell wall hydrolase CwlJ-like protein